MKLLKDSRGMTLMELLLVVILISIIALVVLPRFSYKRILRQKVYVTAHEIAADIRYAQRLSLSGNKDVASVLPADKSTKQTYWFKVYSAGNSTDTFRVFKQNSEASYEKTTSTYNSDIKIAGSSTDSLYFNQLGEPVPATGTVFSVSDVDGNYQWDVSVSRTTGRVSLIQIR